MISPFGVDHGISKAWRDDSKKKKAAKVAAGVGAAGLIGGAAVGGAKLGRGIGRGLKVKGMEKQTEAAIRRLNNFNRAQQ